MLTFKIKLTFQLGEHPDVPECAFIWSLMTSSLRNQWCTDDVKCDHVQVWQVSVQSYTVCVCVRNVFWRSAGRVYTVAGSLFLAKRLGICWERGLAKLPETWASAAFSSCPTPSVPLPSCGGLCACVSNHWTGFWGTFVLRSEQNLTNLSKTSH